MSTTQTVPEPVQDSSGFGGADDLSFLDDPANLVTSDSSPERETNPEETPQDNQADDDSAEEETSEQTATEGAFKGIKPAVVAILKHLAKQEALDLSDPRDFKVARMIAEKENRIRELQLAQEPTEEARNYLDAFRDPARPETPAQNGYVPQQVPPEQTQPEYRQLADKWGDEAAFYSDFMDAMEMNESPEKPKRLSNVLFGVMDVAMRSQHLPAILHMVNQIIDHRVGPAVQQADEVRQGQMIRETVDTLAKQKGFEDIETLFEPASDGVLEYNGNRIADTWVNRAVIAVPDILDIKVGDGKSAESKRMTTAKQYAAAFQVMRMLRTNSSDTTAVNRGVTAGLAIERSKRDPVRQALNAGKPRSAPTGDRMFDEIVNAGDGTTSFNSVFK